MGCFVDPNCEEKGAHWHPGTTDQHTEKLTQERDLYRAALVKASQGDLSINQALAVLGIQCAHEWDPSIRSIHRYCMKCKGREDVLNRTLKDFGPVR